MDLQKILALFLPITLALTSAASPGKPGNFSSLDQVKATFFEICPFANTKDLHASLAVRRQFVSKKPLVVEIDVSLMRLIEISDSEQRLSLFIGFAAYWIFEDCPESCLTFFDEETCNNTYTQDSVYFTFKKDQVFYPKLVHDNGFANVNPLDEFFKYVTIYPFTRPYGYIIAPGRIDTACSGFTPEKFPFDTLTCDLRLYSADDMRYIEFELSSFGIGEEETGSVFLTEASLWSFDRGEINCSIQPVELDDGLSYAMIVISMKFHRKFNYYILTVLTPAIGLFLIHLGSLFLEPNMPDRPIFGAMATIAFMFLLSMVNSLVPQNFHSANFIYIVEAKYLSGIALTLYALLISFLAKSKKACKIIKIFNVVPISLLRAVDICFAGCLVSLNIFIDLTLFCKIMK